MKATAEVPIGKREDQHLELMGRDSLREQDRLAIGREVVAMLNGDGGEIWIGVAEQGGRAVEVEPIPDVEPERRSLQDYLIDVIEPPLTQDEIEVEAVGKLLRLLVRRRPERGPYSLRGKGGAIYFPVRIGDRIRPMAREEQRAAFAGEPAETNRLGEALRAILDWRSELQKEGRERLSIRVAPTREDSLSGRQDEIVELLRDPGLTGNRRTSGWTFANPYVTPEKGADGSVSSRWPASPYESEDWYSVEVRRDGTVHYQAGLERFSYHGARGQERAADEPPELWPLAIAELPVSVLRLAATMYAGHLGDDDQVIADLSLFGLRGWRLRPGSPRFLGHRVVWNFPEASVFEGQDLLLTDPLVFRWPEVKANPDRCGFRLVRLVYREFGYGEEAISVDLFDPRSGKLRLAS
jgi:hypothetical protein